MKRSLATGLKLVVSLTLVWMLYRNTPAADIWRTVRAIHPGFLPAAAVILLSNTLLSAWKWRILLIADGIVIPIRQLFGSYLIGTFFNLFLPSNIGGDAYRIYDVARLSRSASRSFAAVFADRLSGFFALILLALASACWVVGRIGDPQLVLLPAAALVAVLLVLALCLYPQPMLRLLAKTPLVRFANIWSFINEVLTSLRHYRTQPVVLVRIMAISFLFQSLLILYVYLMARALGVEIAFGYFGAFVPLITLLEALPISIYGLGVRDFGYVFFFSKVGMTALETRSLAILFLFTTMVYALSGGVLFIWKHARRRVA